MNFSNSFRSRTTCLCRPLQHLDSLKIFLQHGGVTLDVSFSTVNLHAISKGTFTFPVCRTKGRPECQLQLLSAFDLSPTRSAEPILAPAMTMLLTKSTGTILLLCLFTCNTPVTRTSQTCPRFPRHPRDIEN